MVQAVRSLEPETRAYLVLRPICIGGERVEIGSAVQLTRLQGSELSAANKVVLAPEKPAKATRSKPAEPAAAATVTNTIEAKS